MGAVELLPCPFCGSSASLDVRLLEHPNWWCGCVICDGIVENVCSAQIAVGGDTEQKAKETAIAAWNRRAFGKEVRLEGDTLYFEGLGTFERVKDEH
jgi:hypothetical protein